MPMRKITSLLFLFNVDGTAKELNRTIMEMRLELTRGPGDDVYRERGGPQGGRRVTKERRGFQGDDGGCGGEWLGLGRQTRK